MSAFLPIRCGSKTNPDQVNRVFPRLVLDKKQTHLMNNFFPARSMYFGLIYDTRTKALLTEETKIIYVTDIRNESE